MKPYSLLVTSCGRPDLLKRSVTSFLQFAEQGPRELIVLDDGDMPRPDWFPRHNTKWLNNGRQLGQIFTCDKLFEQCSTEYAFWMEDDWQFIESGFLEKSFEILEKSPDVHSVMVRNDQHPIDWALGWGHFSFNPGLRRTSDYRQLGSYGRHTGYSPDDRSAELLLSRLHKDRGFRLESLPKHCWHIGETSHVIRSTAKPLPKILVVIPTAANLDYSAFRENQKRVHGANLVERFPDGLSGLQHDGPNARQQAVRDTWFNDALVHSNVRVEFFDGSRCGCPDDHMHVVHKGMFAYLYAYEQGFDWAFKCDDDTLVFLDRLVRQTIEMPDGVDYAGLGQCDFGWGGVGYWISRRGLQLMLQESVPDISQEWREDFWTGQILSKHGIRLHDMNCQLQVNYDRPAKPPVSVHPVSPDRMRELYAHPENLSY
jgi:hypothetical protein